MQPNVKIFVQFTQPNVTGLSEEQNIQNAVTALEEDVRAFLQSGGNKQNVSITIDSNTVRMSPNRERFIIFTACVSYRGTD